MPTFTITLHDAMRSHPDIEGVILKNYPVVDEAHRDRINSLFVDRYMNDEIGHETVTMFKVALRYKLNLLMPTYNKQYKASQLEFDPLETIGIRSVSVSDVDTKSTSTGSNTAEGTSESLSKSDAKSRAVASEFPQHTLSENGDYATSSQDNISGTTATGEAADKQTSATEDESVSEQDATTDSTTTGYQGSRSLLLMQYREALVNVDQMLIAEFQDLFMQVWTNGDEFTERNSRYGWNYYI